MFSLVFPVGILFPTGHKVSCLIKLIGDFMNNLENKIKELEKENGRLKKLVADLSLDNAILRDVNSKNF